MTTHRADVVIIGGGIIGMSIAAHLSARKGLSLLVLERAGGHQAGSTARATGGFRAQFGSRINVQLSLLSESKLLSFENEHAVDPRFERFGYLFVAESREAMEQLRQANALQRSEGIEDADVIDAEECLRLQPLLRRDRVAGGTFRPGDGYIRPMQILDGYMKSATRRGTRILYESAVVASTSEGEMIRALQLSNGDTVLADFFVNAAGAWAANIGQILGVDVPVVPLKRQVAVLYENDILALSSPMTIVADDGWHTRPRDGRALILRPDVPLDPASLSVEDEWLFDLQKRTEEVAPKLAQLPIDRSQCWAGLYEVSPDGHAILGKSAGCENLFLANGSSGHGVMHAPAIGELLAQLICREPTSIDISALSPDRFTRGSLVQSIELL